MPADNSAGRDSRCMRQRISVAPRAVRVPSWGRAVRRATRCKSPDHLYPTIGRLTGDEIHSMVRRSNPIGAHLQLASK